MRRTTVTADVKYNPASLHYAIPTTESISKTNRFCVSLTPVSNHSTILADVGCWDAVGVGADHP